MKNKIKILLLFVVVIALASVVVIVSNFFGGEKSSSGESTKNTDSDDKTVVAIVEGKEIFKETIDFLAEGEKISNQNSPSTSGEVLSEVDTNAILQKQIRNMVVLAEAERLGLSASFEEAEAYTKQNFELVKEIGGQTYETILDYMEAMEMSEEEYLEKAAEANRNMLTRGKLYEKFVEGKTGTRAELEAEYEKYVEELIEKADIEYVN